MLGAGTALAGPKVIAARSNTAVNNTTPALPERPSPSPCGRRPEIKTGRRKTELCSLTMA